MHAKQPNQTDRPKKQFICFLSPARPEMPDSPTPEEAELVGKHFNYYQSLLAESALILAGRTLEPPFTGIMIFESTDRDAAQTIVNADPAVQAGVFNARLQPYSVALMRDQS